MTSVWRGVVLWKVLARAYVGRVVRTHDERHSGRA